MKPISQAYGEYLCSHVVSQVNQSYGWPFKQKKLDCAKLAAQETVRYLNTGPIGWNYGDSQKFLRKRVEDHVKSIVIPQLAFPLLWFIFQAIINYVVKYIIDNMRK